MSDKYSVSDDTLALIAQERRVEISRLQQGLRKIIFFGNNSPGRGWTCGKMAERLLNQSLKEFPE